MSTGIPQQTLLDDAYRAIREGVLDVALVTGGEAARRAALARRAGLALVDTVQEDATPDDLQLPRDEIITRIEIEGGVASAMMPFALIDSALRFAEGRSLDQHRDEIAVLPRPPVLCAGCAHRGVLSIIKRMGILATGDIGCYTLGCLPPYEALHTTFCMGASIGNATGFNKAGEREVVAVIGDSTFLHGGLPSLISAVYNQVPTTMILLDNGTTGMTGHQQHPGTGHTLKGNEAPAVDYEQLIRSLGVEHVEVIDPWNLESTEAAIEAALAHPGPAVVIAQRPCTLLPEEKSKTRIAYRVDTDECIVCEECMDVGCPALVWEDGFPYVREWECVGCSLCGQTCVVDAIHPVGES